jgi:hypothetical protein
VECRVVVDFSPCWSMPSVVVFMLQILILCSFSALSRIV